MTTQPGALDGVGLRHVVAVLSTVQIVSWGVLYYAFAALQSSITADTGWSSVAVTGAFSLAQFISGGVGIWVGRHIDDFGPRKVMTAASLVAIPGVATIALAPNLAVFYLGWAVAGVAMAGTLYPPAFAALTRWGGSRRVRALTTLTLVAGLASTVFAPLASGLDDWLGWRQAYLVLLVGLALITVPLHWWGLNHPWRQTTANAEPGGDTAAVTGDRAQVRQVARSTPFVLLNIANALVSLSAFAVLINLVPMLIEQGMSRNVAALALGLGGVGQVIGRLGYAPVRGRDLGDRAHRQRHPRPRRGHRRPRPGARVRGAAHRAGDGPGTGARHLHPHPGHRHHRPVGTGRLRHPQRHPDRARPGRRRRGTVRRRRARRPARRLLRRLPGPGWRGRRRRRTRRRSHPAGARPTCSTRRIRSVIIELDEY